MAGEKRFFYGWILVGVLWFCYGFGISPAYYSWSVFAPKLVDELGFDRGNTGGVFGWFTFVYSGVGPLVGLSMARWGARTTMTGGFLMSAVGLFLMSRADSLIDCYIGFSILGGAGIGFATIIPCQTVAQHWFLKRRALAIAIIFTAGGIVGKIVTRYDSYMLEHYDWRAGWLYISGVSVLLAIFAAIFVRDTPEQLGQHVDGEAPAADPSTKEDDVSRIQIQPDTSEWTAGQAMRTPQFLLMIICGIAFAVPWGVSVSQMTFHFLDLGFEQAVAASFVGTMALISIAGRFMGLIGDFFAPQAVLSVALVLEGLGCVGLLFGETVVIAYVSITLIAIGFGTAYISVPVVFSNFFGRKAFGMTSGVRIFVTGIFNALGPWIAGMIFDSRGSYAIPFTGIAVLCVIGSIAAATLRHPGKPPSETIAIERSEGQ